ncbi:hypothetical protein CONPUDRAFT_99077 [Coniophora puteana RWD-64-598 SS2]|uniref:Phosphotransferase n=1 Tax=Coniophora puteana (strain RWD-64-598) TaxID=741705 RepID=A0A5M3MXW8_CONPW|nr:uncharacterized protein CONPUDRAFT_99077 [Coniophora puteana RWD-64-598 SS2]EIW83575.1 hypothetical protein CONPUDRAFT_99077 [Coniophora puteana RWD-64-598 SS2]
MDTPDPSQLVDDVEAQFTLDAANLLAVTRAFLEDIRTGLSKYGHVPMAMVPTYLTEIPNGAEKGTSLAIDLGGTNLRVCEVEFNGDRTYSSHQQKYKVSDEYKLGEATALFDYIAECVHTFLHSPSLESSSVYKKCCSGHIDHTHPFTAPVQIALAFSFPYEQRAINSGALIRWSKGFAAKNAVGQDIVKLLQDAFDKKKMSVECAALVNDCAGALVARAYTSGGCDLATIFGTGTNGVFVEHVNKVTKLNDDRDLRMIVNTEWGAFDNDRKHLPKTPFDLKLDHESLNPGGQAFGKAIAGMFLGEVARNAFLSLVDAGALFGGKLSAQMGTQWGFDTELMSAVEEAWAGVGAHAPMAVGGGLGGEIPVRMDDGKEGTDGPAVPPLSSLVPGNESISSDQRAALDRVRSVLIAHCGYAENEVSLRDAMIVRRIVVAIAQRGAQLAGCGVAAVLVQMGFASHLRGESSSDVEANGDVKAAEVERRINMGVDGSLIEHFPNYERSLRSALKLLVGEDVESRLGIGMGKDGSGVGAALCVLQAQKDAARFS